MLLFAESITEKSGPTQALQIGFELALKERDAVLRENVRAVEERDQALRQYAAMKNERDWVMSSLEGRAAGISPKMNNRSVVSPRICWFRFSTTC